MPNDCNGQSQSKNLSLCVLNLTLEFDWGFGLKAHSLDPTNGFGLKELLLAERDINVNILLSSFLF